MLIRRCAPPTSGRRSRRASRPTGPRRCSPSRPKDSVAERCGDPRAAAAGRVGGELGSTSRARTDGAGARQQPLPAARPEAHLGHARTHRGRQQTRTPTRPLRLSRRRRRSSRAGMRLSPSSRRLERPSVRARARFERTTFDARRAARCAHEPDGAWSMRTRSSSGASGKQGYGVSPGMARRCFERMDAEGITGRIDMLQSPL